LRPSAVIGFRCPVSGRLRKPIFIVLHHSFDKPSSRGARPAILEV
jgi:hypothetical protein